MFGHKHKIPNSFITVTEKGLICPVFGIFPGLFHRMANNYFIDVNFGKIGVISLMMTVKLKHVTAK